MGKNIGVILAGGKGLRFGADLPKQFVKIHGKMIIEYTIENMISAKKIDEIHITINPKYKELGEKLAEKYPEITKVTEGGRTRTESIYNAVRILDEDVEKVVFNDAVRPFVPGYVLDDMLDLLDMYPVVKFASKIVDYLAFVDDQQTIQRIDDRSKWLLCKAPVAYRAKTLREIQSISSEEDILSAESDLQLALAKIPGIQIHPYVSDIFNYKITYREDLEIARKLLE